MKKLFTAIILIMGVNGCILAQTNNKRNADTSNIYYQSLKLHIKADSDLFDSIKLVKPDTFFVCGSWMTENLPQKIGSFNVAYLYSNEIKTKIRHGDVIYIADMRPIEIENDKVKLGIINFYVKKEKRKIIWSHESSSVIEYKFNCNNGHFELLHFQLD